MSSMISILCQYDLSKEKLIDAYFDNNNLEQDLITHKFRSRKFYLKDVLRLNYKKTKYRRETDLSQPNNIPSRIKIFEENDILFDGNKVNEIFVNTITTKQDRNKDTLALIKYIADEDKPEKILENQQVIMTP